SAPTHRLAHLVARDREQPRLRRLGPRLEAGDRRKCGGEGLGGQIEGFFRAGCPAAKEGEDRREVAFVEDPERLRGDARSEQELTVGALLFVLHALFHDAPARFVTGATPEAPATLSQRCARSKCRPPTSVLASSAGGAPKQAAAEAKERRDLSGRGAFFMVQPAGPSGRSRMVKVEAVIVRERVETVIDAVEEETGHVGVTVVEAIGHGRERGVTHEYRGRTFESRFLPKALL